MLGPSKYWHLKIKIELRIKNWKLLDYDVTVWSQVLNSKPLDAKNMHGKLGLTTSNGVPSPKSQDDIDAYMATFFEGKAWDLW